MKHLIDKPRPGDFRAVCKKPRWVPLSVVQALPDDEQPKDLTTKWDPKLHCEVAAVRCSLDTTDRAEFERHMKEVHGVQLSRELNHQRGHTGFSSKRWKAPRLTETGKPWTEKEAAGRTRTCPACGLVDEITTGSYREWSAHLSACEQTARVAS